VWTPTNRWCYSRPLLTRSDRSGVAVIEPYPDYQKFRVHGAVETDAATNLVLSRLEKQWIMPSREWSLAKASSPF